MFKFVVFLVTFLALASQALSAVKWNNPGSGSDKRPVQLLKKLVTKEITASELNDEDLCLSLKFLDLPSTFYEHQKRGLDCLGIKNSQKGLSFSHKGKLNMRMGINDFSANEIISNMDENNLAKVFKVFGGEKYSKKIAKKIVAKRKDKTIKTEDLVQIIDNVKKYQITKIHNSTKVFQALRILVNKEISELINGLINSFNLRDASL